VGRVGRVGNDARSSRFGLCRERYAPPSVKLNVHGFSG